MFKKINSYFFICGLALSSSALALDVSKNDAELIQHIKKHDFVFNAVLGKCHNEQLHRSNKKDLKFFNFKAICEIKPLPETDCQSYRVTASGTVDTPEWATVRNMQLELQCSS